MSRVIVDEILEAKLQGCNQHLELCDENGNPLGHFLPAAEYWKLQLAADHCPLSYEEIQRRRLEKGTGKPLREIWKTLGAT
jgi:hypothetical protein